MDIQETITQVATKQAEFIEQNATAVTAITDEVQSIKSQVTELAETKSAVNTALASTQETITSLQEQIEQLQDAQAKGMHSMSTIQEPIANLKFTDYVAALTKAVQEKQYGEVKNILNSQDPNLALMFLPTYTNDVVVRLKDMSPIFTYAKIKPVSGVNDQTMIKVQLKDCSDIRTGVGENKEGAIVVDTGTGDFADYKPTWTKLESKLTITVEFAQDGEIDVSTMIATIPDLMTRKAAYVALYGDSKMKGLLSMFKSILPDAERAYNEFQYLEMPKGFGDDFEITITTLQDMIASMPLEYRKKDLPLVMGENLFNKLTRCQNKAGQQLITNLYTDGYDGRILNRPVIIDPYMPDYRAADSVVLMFGDFERAVQFYSIDGAHEFQKSAEQAGNTHIYDSMRMGLRMNDNFALKALKTPKAAK